MLITEETHLKNFYSAKRIWQGIPSIERTQNGRLFASFYSGGTREQLGNYCILLMSNDDGITWSEPIAAAYAGENSRCFDPELWIDPSGRLWFTWAQVPNNAVWAAVCDSPDEDDIRWNEPRIIGGEVMMNKPTVLSTGEWLFPMAVWKVPHIASSPVNKDCRSFAYLTEDGMEFKKIGGADAKNSTYDEHYIVELKNGKLWMLIRTNSGIAQSFSYDGGNTWTAAEESGFATTSTRFAIRRLSSGNLLFVYNSDTSKRSSLTAMLSRDDGNTWEGKLLIDCRENVSYPDFTQASDGMIYLIYDRERGGYHSSVEEARKEAREILMSKFREEDVIAGKIVCEDSRLQIVVNRLGEYDGEDLFQKEQSKSELAFIRRLSMITDTEILCDEIFRTVGINCATYDCKKIEELDSCFDLLKNTDELNLFDRGEIIKEIISILREGHGSSSEKSVSQPKQLVEKVIEHLHNHISENITLKDITETISVSRYYLCHIFKNETGITMIQYLLELRIREAKCKLKQTDSSITDIAMNVGFNNVTYFTKVFKSCVGRTPGEYRNKFKK